MIRNLVEKHGLWCGIPSLRSFHPSLGEYIRVLYQDLHDTHATLQNLEESHQKLLEDHEDLVEKYSQVRQESNVMSEKYLHVEEEEKRRERQEREWSRVNEEMRSVMISGIQLMEKQNQDTLRLSVRGGEERGKIQQQQQKAKRSEENEGDVDDEPEPYEPIDSEGSEGEEGDGEGRRGHGSAYRKGKGRDFHHLRDDEIQLEDLLDDFSPHTSRAIPSSEQSEGPLFEISSPIRRKIPKSESSEVGLTFLFSFCSHSPLPPWLPSDSL